MKRIDDHRPLLWLLPDLPDDERFAFIQGEDGVVGWGIAASVAVGPGADRFARARDGFRAVFEADGIDVERGSSGEHLPRPLAFASFTFDPDDAGSVMIVPAVSIVRRHGATWQIEVGNTDYIANASTPSFGPRVEADRPRYAGSTVRDDLWLDSVAHAVDAIAHGAYDKVVLARDLTLWSRSPFNTISALGALAEQFPTCSTFLVDHLLGASPETLLRRSGSTVYSRVLAGTASRATDRAEDARRGVALLASDKERREHDLALLSAVEALAPQCSSLSVPDAPSLVRLANVQHLGSDLNGELAVSSDGTLPHILDVLARLHPTAAVGGAPREQALSAIRDLEQMQRGRYAGPIGWCSTDGDGEFAIALRCAEVRGRRARLFAGAGIVAGSLPEAELAETRLKLRAMTQVLYHSGRESSSPTVRV